MIKIDNIQKYILLLSLFIPLFLSAQSTNDSSENKSKGVRLVKVNALCEKDNMLCLQMEISIKGKTFAKHEALRITPKLVSKEGFYLFPDVVIQRRNKQKAYNRWMSTRSGKQLTKITPPDQIIGVKAKADTVIHYAVKVPYQNWMDDALFAVNEEVIGYREKTKMNVYSLSHKVARATRALPQTEVIVATPKGKIRSFHEKAHLDFEVDEVQIVREFGNNAQELDRIGNFIAEVGGNKEIKPQTFLIKGFASPDGTYAHNARVAQERSQALKDYILDRFALPVAPENLNVISIGEDWDGLKAAIEAETMEYKDEVLSIIEQVADLERREALLRKLDGGKVWKILLMDYFPSLRRVECQVDYLLNEHP